MHHHTCDSRGLPRPRPTPLALALNAALIAFLVPHPAAHAQSTSTDAAEATLPVVKVHASPEGAQDSGFVRRRSDSATKTVTPLVETPQSISVIGSEEMAARGVTSVTEAVRYTPGILAETYGSDDRGTPWFSIRGFEDIYTSSYLDGLRQPAFSYTVQINEAYGLDRIDVVRGPSSVMFGQVDAGGIVNRVRKLPTADAPREVLVQLGNLGRKQLAADVGGTLGTDGQLLYRLVATGHETDAQARYPGFDAETRKRIFRPEGPQQQLRVHRHRPAPHAPAVR
jgi:iron complex outermembrane receptor protein